MLFQYKNTYMERQTYKTIKIIEFSITAKNTALQSVTAWLIFKLTILKSIFI